MSKKKESAINWKVEYTISAKKEIDALDGSAKKIIKKAIEDKLMTEPLKFGLPLRRSLKNFFKLRVGDYRIIYQIENQEVTVLVIKVAHRREVYEE
jgi:addiction module RelE/StbE family toxin